MAGHMRKDGYLPINHGFCVVWYSCGCSHQHIKMAACFFSPVSKSFWEKAILTLLDNLPKRALLPFCPASEPHHLLHPKRCQPELGKPHTLGYMYLVMYLKTPQVRSNQPSSSLKQKASCSLPCCLAAGEILQKTTSQCRVLHRVDLSITTYIKKNKLD